MFRFAPLILICSLAACGGDDSGGGSSGVDSSKKLNTLTADERQDVCEAFAAAQGSVQSKDCGDGITITVQTTAECVSSLSAVSASCTATVANVEACGDAAGDDLCSLISSPSCAFLFQCAGGDGVK